MNADTDIDPRNLRWYARPHRVRIVTLAGLSFVGGVVEAAFLVIATRTGLAVAGGEDTILLWPSRTVSIWTGISIAGLLVGFRLIPALGSVAVSTRLAELVTITQRDRLANAYFETSWPIRETEPAGRLQHLLITFTEHVTNLANSLSQGVTGAVSLTALLVFSLLVDPLATLLVLGSLSFLVFTLSPIRRAVSRSASTAAAVQVEFAEDVAEFGGIGLELHTFGVADAVRRRLSAQARKEARARRRVDGLVQSVTPLYISFAYALVLAALIAAIQIGEGELQSFGAVLLIMLRSLTYGQQIQTTMAYVKNQLPVLEQIESSIGRYSSSREPVGSQPVSTMTPVVFTDVAFQYSEGVPVLSGVSFEIERGEIVGVIGPSGSGKTTLIQLLMGVREPTSGMATVGGHDLRTARRTDLARLVGFVPQTPTILSSSVRDNVTFFRNQVPDERVLTALRRAHISAEVSEMARGIDTFVGERGSGISGGQQQRLSIARAVLDNPQLLILDEPTSALDSESEAAVRTSLREVASVSTVVIVAHRLSTLEICDRIMIVRGNCIEAFDTPQWLRENNDYFASISQSGVLQ
ncbi:MAG: ABC transporter ATP-binding protein [SAR202 cluster bacterium]|jgi:ABC-type multidrug transport system fused ATPase/permease subunit|nr:ABC transporter ATP-binding protein [SAR202 cluster bacterium]